MNSLIGFLLIWFLVLIQTTLWPVNLAFAGLVWYYLFVEKVLSWVWLFTIALLLSVFGNFNLGLTTIGLTSAFLFLELIGKIIPTNRLTKSFLVLLALPLAEISLLIFARLL